METVTGSPGLRLVFVAMFVGDFLGASHETDGKYPKFNLKG